MGITCQKPEQRWRRGNNYCSNQVFSRAVGKYGWENIRHEILYNGLSEDEAKETEIRLIKDLNARDRKHGYNLTDGGDGMAGFVTREETKRKLSNINKGKHHTEASKKKMSETRAGEQAYWYGKHLPEDVKMRLSQMKKGKYQGKNNPMFGKKMSLAEREKMSERHYDCSGANNPRARHVMQYDSSGVLVKTYETITSAAQERGCCFSTMRRYLVGKFRDSSGYEWRYA